jgi:hypothetical protein
MVEKSSSFDFDQINFDQLRQLHVFQTNTIKFEPHFYEVQNRIFPGSTRMTLPFTGTTSFTPFKLPSGVKPEPIDTQARQHGKWIEKGRVDFTKGPCAIIYNPSSGKKRDIR